MMLNLLKQGLTPFEKVDCSIRNYEEQRANFATLSVFGGRTKLDITKCRPKIWLSVGRNINSSEVFMH